LKLAQIEAKLALKRAQKRKKKEISSTLSTLQVPQSPSPRTAPLVTNVARPPPSPQRIVLGIDRGKKASEVSLKSWKPPTLSPEKPHVAFAERLASVTRDTKRKSQAIDERDRKKSRTFTPVIRRDLPDQDEWCKYTGFNLRTRVIEQSVLREEFKGKTVYSISELCRNVTPPLYEAPEYDTLDFLVTGIVAAKSPVRQVKGNDGGNYIIIKLADLKVSF
jgi:hypothetical protein